MAVGQAVGPAVAVVAVVLDGFVVDGLHHRHGIGLDDVDRHLDDVLDRNLNDALHRHWVVDGDLNNPLNWDLDDLLNRVGHGLVDLHVLDLDNGHGDLPDNGDLDRVGLSHGHLHGVGLGHRVGLGNLVGHFTENLVGLVAHAVLSGSALVVGEAVDLVDGGVLRSGEAAVATEASTEASSGSSEGGTASSERGTSDKAGSRVGSRGDGSSREAARGEAGDRSVVGQARTRESSRVSGWSGEA